MTTHVYAIGHKVPEADRVLDDLILHLHDKVGVRVCENGTCLTGVMIQFEQLAEIIAELRKEYKTGTASLGLRNVHDCS